MRINIPGYVNRIIDALNSQGHKAYLVGGCVRDSILGKEPADYDIATSADPSQMEKAFLGWRTFEPGRVFGTISVVQEEGVVEVTAFRKDLGYSDGRRPDRVEFTKDVTEDLKRRDFTINAMAYSHSTGIIDPFGGRGDIDKKLIRCVGDPMERLSEDYLRILRAVRFSSQLDFTIEISTADACTRLSAGLDKISVERIREELFKILLSHKPSKGFLMMRSLGILKEVIPELIPAIGFDQRNPHHDRSVFQHTLTVMDNTPPVLHLRLAAMLHDIGKPYTFSVDEYGVGHFYGHDKMSVKIGKEFMVRMKCSTELMEKTLNLVKEHMVHHPDLRKKGLKRQLQRVGSENIYHLVDLQIADRLSKKGSKDISKLIAKKEVIEEILDAREPFRKSHLAINGNDLKFLGYKEGKVIGKLLEYLLNCVLERPEINTREQLTRILMDLYPPDSL